MTSLDQITFQDNSLGEFKRISEENPGKLNSTQVVQVGNKDNSSKKWYIIAIIVGSFVVIGFGGFAAVGLLQSYGVISLPQSFQWLTSAIGAIGQTSNFWSLWVTAVGGLIVGSGLIAFGVYGVKKASTLLNLKDIPHSSDRAHRMTWALQAPFNFCVRTAISIIYPFSFQASTGQKVWEVFKRALKAIAVIALFIPASLLYGLGTISAYVFDTPKIDTSMLHQRPSPSKDLAMDLVHDIDILQQLFDEEGLSKYRAEFSSMITNIKKKNQVVLDAYKGLPPTFYDDMTLYLQNIIDLLQQNPQKRRNVLIALAEAAKVCPPTWYEVAKKQRALLVNPNMAEEQLLHWIQDMKEEIILEFAQNTFDQPWHALNYVRYHVGEELGLNWEGLENDPYFSQKENAQFTKGFILSVFKANFHIDDLITVLQMKINETYQVQFYNLLQDAIVARGVKNVEEAVAFITEHFYEEDCCTMKRNGVIMLLKIIGCV